MITRFYRNTVLFLMLLLSFAAVASAPVDEIRDLLREKLMPAPDESLLAKLSDENLVEGLLLLDPYARYLKPEQGYAILPETVDRAGIGAEILLQQDQILILPYQGSVSERAGVLYRSQLLKINEQPITSYSLLELAGLLLGEEDSWVSLLVKTPEQELVEFRFQREIYRPLHVELLHGDQRIIRIRNFIASTTVPALRATIDFLSSGNQNSHLPNVIIDLRDSTGGELFEALDLAGIFLPASTELVTMVNREDQLEQFYAPRGNKYDNPLFILIGPHTASAAEIFTGVLQAHGRAIVLGEPSFGKCSSQTEKRLSNHALLRYTNREVLLPGGEICSGVGITPDLFLSSDQRNDAEYLLKSINQWNAQKQH
ncbi:MAG: carboxyl-terminal protease [Oceanospirillales bacterium]|nr:MAG: carboxyl-terminal protease [Oceanospirillales bacterium]